jgi:type II restriction enzyme
VELPRRQFYKLIESFSGWLQLTLEGIAKIESNVFTMEQVWVACSPIAQNRFPQNRHSREKLRQQMQRLRDLGLVLFLGNGRYERLALVK